MNYSLFGIGLEEKLSEHNYSTDDNNNDDDNDNENDDLYNYTMTVR
jgi:hypothetical protein